VANGSAETEWDLHDALHDGILSFSGWNQTSSPCSTLVLDHMRDSDMSLTDIHTLKSCLEWRRIANRTIHDLNLTELVGHDYLLLSVHDFARALGQKGVVGSLVVHPEAVFHAFQLSPYYAPFESVVRSVALYFYARNESVYPDTLVNETTKLLVGWFEQNRTLPDAPEVRVAMELANTFRGAVHMYSPVRIDDSPPVFAGSESKLNLLLKSESASAAPAVHPRPASVENHDTRRLLEFAEATADAKRYSSLTAYYGANVDPSLAPILADIWTQGPIGWPPNFDAWGVGSSSCVAATSALSVVYESSRVVGKFYGSDAYRSKLTISSWSVQDNLPPLGAPASNNTSPPVYTGDASADVFVWAADLIGLHRESVQSFFSSSSHADHYTLGRVVKELLVCDFESTTLCTKHSRHIFMAVIVSVLLYVVVAFVLGMIRLTALSNLLIVVIPTMVIYLAYGVSPSCFPQVPVCMLGDIIDGLGRFLPAKVAWPVALLYYPTCLGPTWREVEELKANGMPIPSWQKYRNVSHPTVKPMTYECLRPCSGEPFNFVRWESNVAWVVCSVAPSSCANLTIPLFPAFGAEVIRLSGVRAQSNPDTMNAYEFCNAFTFARVWPYVVILLLLVYLVLAALSIPITLVGAVGDLIVSSVSYSHAQCVEEEIPTPEKLLGKNAGEKMLGKVPDDV
jgi:hypothetical protein